MSNITCRPSPTLSGDHLGGDETQPGLPFIRLWNPTEFDKAVEAMRVRIRSEHNWDLFNPKVWELTGLAAGPIKKFLTLYIKESNRLGKPYRQFELAQWEGIFMGTYGYEKDTLHTYLRVLRQLNDEGAISQIIYNPSSYNPTDEDEPGKKIVAETKRTIYGTAGIVTAGLVGYFLLKESLFSGKKR